MKLAVAKKSKKRPSRNKPIQANKAKQVQMQKQQQQQENVLQQQVAGKATGRCSRNTAASSESLSSLSSSTMIKSSSTPSFSSTRAGAAGASVTSNDGPTGSGPPSCPWDPERELPTRGLNNLGNTCFFNASLQAVFKVRLLHEALFGDASGRRQGVYVGPLNKVLRKVLLEMTGEGSTGNVNRTYSPKALLSAVQRAHPSFKGMHQQDAHELFMRLLGTLEDEEEAEIKRRLREAEKERLEEQEEQRQRKADTEAARSRKGRETNVDGCNKNADGCRKNAHGCCNISGDDEGAEDGDRVNSVVSGEVISGDRHNGCVVQDMGSSETANDYAGILSGQDGGDGCEGGGSGVDEEAYRSNGLKEGDGIADARGAVLPVECTEKERSCILKTAADSAVLLSAATELAQEEGGQNCSGAVGNPQLIASVANGDSKVTVAGHTVPVVIEGDEPLREACVDSPGGREGSAMFKQRRSDHGGSGETTTDDGETTDAGDHDDEDDHGNVTVNGNVNGSVDGKVDGNGNVTGNGIGDVYSSANGSNGGDSNHRNESVGTASLSPEPPPIPPLPSPPRVPSPSACEPCRSCRPEAEGQDKTTREETSQRTADSEKPVAKPILPTRPAVTEVFGGMMCSVVTCDACNGRSFSTEPTVCLSLEIPIKKRPLSKTAQAFIAKQKAAKAAAAAAASDSPPGAESEPSSAFSSEKADDVGNSTNDPSQKPSPSKPEQLLPGFELSAKARRKHARVERERQRSIAADGGVREEPNDSTDAVDNGEPDHGRSCGGGDDAEPSEEADGADEFSGLTPEEHDEVRQCVEYIIQVAYNAPDVLGDEGLGGGKSTSATSNATPVGAADEKYPRQGVQTTGSCEGTKAVHAEQSTCDIIDSAETNRQESVGGITIDEAATAIPEAVVSSTVGTGGASPDENSATPGDLMPALVSKSNDQDDVSPKRADAIDCGGNAKDLSSPPGKYRSRINADTKEMPKTPLKDSNDDDSRHVDDDPELQPPEFGAAKEMNPREGSEQERIETQPALEIEPIARNPEKDGRIGAEEGVEGIKEGGAGEAKRRNRKENNVADTDDVTSCSSSGSRGSCTIRETQGGGGDICEDGHTSAFGSDSGEGKDGTVVVDDDTAENDFVGSLTAAEAADDKGAVVDTPEAATKHLRLSPSAGKRSADKTNTLTGHGSGETEACNGVCAIASSEGGEGATTTPGDEKAALCGEDADEPPASSPPPAAVSPFDRLVEPPTRIKSEAEEDPVAVDLYECLDAFMAEERLTAADGNGYDCEVCHSRSASPPEGNATGADGGGADSARSAKIRIKQDSRKRLLMTGQPPGVLVCHLKRLQAKKKIKKNVEFPMELDMAPYFWHDPEASLSPTDTHYRLFALVQHVGSSSWGHYVAYVKDKDGWQHASDSTIRPATLPEVKNCEAYMLFYERCDQPAAATMEPRDGTPVDITETPLVSAQTIDETDDAVGLSLAEEAAGGSLEEKVEVATAKIAGRRDMDTVESVAEEVEGERRHGRVAEEADRHDDEANNAAGESGVSAGSSFSTTDSVLLSERRVKAAGDTLASAPAARSAIDDPDGRSSTALSSADDQRVGQAADGTGQSIYDT